MAVRAGHRRCCGRCRRRCADRVPFGGFPWGRLAFSQGDSPLLGFAAVGGAPLVTFATALVGGLLVALSMIVHRLAGVRTGRAGPMASSQLVTAARPWPAPRALVVVAGLAVPTTAPGGTRR